MDYEKEYKSLVAKVKKAHQFAQTDSTKSVLEDILPQLRESEDEKIRKWLVDYFGSIKETVWIHRDITCEQILFYLENQKERKPIGGIYWHAIKKGEKLPCRAYVWNRDFEKYPDCWEGRLIPNLEKICVGIDTWYLPAKDVRDLPREGIDELPEEQKEQKPAEWSEEDENVLKYLHDLISWGYAEKFMDAQTAHDMRVWINERLRHDTFQNGNSRWKPSEEQMKALQNAVALTACDKELTRLYEQLKKL